MARVPDSEQFPFDCGAREGNFRVNSDFHSANHI